MNLDEMIKVGMADLKVGKSPDVLTTLGLGSCVGVAIYDPVTKISGLDSDYENVCENSRLKTVIFGDRFPFRYLVDDYGIDYYAAFAGCSAETEASFKTVTFLSGKIDEIGTGSILVIDGSDKRIANTIKGNTSQKNQQILTMDSMQSAGTDDADYTYLNVMSNNLVVLKQALQ